jgi:hypothetical protein
MNDKQEAPIVVKKKGRPKAKKTGAMIWVSAELLESVTEFIELMKRQQNRQAKQ